MNTKALIICAVADLHLCFSCAAAQLFFSIRLVDGYRLEEITHNLHFIVIWQNASFDDQEYPPEFED